MVPLFQLLHLIFPWPHHMSVKNHLSTCDIFGDCQKFLHHLINISLSLSMVGDLVPSPFFEVLKSMFMILTVTHKVAWLSTPMIDVICIFYFVGLSFFLKHSMFFYYFLKPFSQLTHFFFILKSIIMRII